MLFTIFMTSVLLLKVPATRIIAACSRPRQHGEGVAVQVEGGQPSCSVKDVDKPISCALFIYILLTALRDCTTSFAKAYRKHGSCRTLANVLRREQ
jgi:hypothetical protein